MPSMDADSRALAAFNAHVAYFRGLIEASGGSVAHERGVLTWAGPHPLPFLINTALRTDPAVDPAVVRKTADAVFKSLGRSYELAGLVGRDDDLIALIESTGVEVGAPDPIQMVEPGSFSGVATVPELELRAVTDPDGVAAVARINQDAVAVYGFPKGVFAQLFERSETVLRPEIHAVVAYRDDRPVATAQVLDVDGLAYVGWVAVARGEMRRGLGGCLTSTVVSDAFARGASAAVLVASPMGGPLYRKLGFADVGGIRSATVQPR